MKDIAPGTEVVLFSKTGAPVRGKKRYWMTAERSNLGWPIVRFEPPNVSDGHRLNTYEWPPDQLKPA